MNSPEHACADGASAQSFILCDDVRIENNNKAIMIGVYAESVNFNELPAAVVVRPVVTFRSYEPGTCTVWCRFRWPGVETIVEGGEPLTWTSDLVFTGKMHQIQIPLPPLPLNVSEPGLFSMETSANGHDWHLVATIPLNCETSTLPVE